MEVQKVLYMKGGDGETSYAKNSSLQREIIRAARPVFREALLDLYQLAVGFPGKLTVADLGCSSGPNALTVMADLVDTVGKSCRLLGRSAPEFQLFLNDLPGNDFNSVFRYLEAFYEERERGSTTETRRCFVAGVPGSFHGRLFPSRSIHFFHSSSSLHWLSQVPPKLQQNEVIPLNKGSIYTPARSAPAVVHAYSTQFRQDFSNFLKCRSEEMVVGGRMVLTLVGRKDMEHSTGDEAHFHWDILIDQLLMDMAVEGCIEAEKVHSFHLPYYAPSAEELEREIRSEGSFFVKRLEMFEVSLELASQERRRRLRGDDYGGEPSQYHGFDQLPATTEKNDMSNSRGWSMSNCVRAVVESMLKSHLGGGDDTVRLLQDLFSRYREVVNDHLSRDKPPMLPNIVMSLVRKPD